MPELPEVETSVRALRDPLLGDTFTGARIYWPRHIDRPDPESFQQRIVGLRVEEMGRRGKYMVFSLSHDETLIVHLRMTGHLSVVARDTPVRDHTHTILALASGNELRFRDTRKFGRLYLVRDPAEVLDKLGPEPLDPDFTPDVLASRLERRSMRMKSLLLDQSFIAGVGNIYADEALFHARIHPRRPANTLNESDIVALHTAIQKVLREGIAREGASIDRYRKPDGTRGDMQNAVAVFRRTGDPCPRCDTPIRRIILGGRSTHFCPVCQLNGQGE